MTVQRPARIEDARTGQQVITWQTVGQRWAEVRPRTAREVTYAQQQEHRVTHIVTMRYADDVSADCRLVYDGRVLNVVGVINAGERNVELEITASEVK